MTDWQNLLYMGLFGECSICGLLIGGEVFRQPVMVIQLLYKATKRGWWVVEFWELGQPSIDSSKLSCFYLPSNLLHYGINKEQASCCSAASWVCHHVYPHNRSLSHSPPTPYIYIYVVRYIFLNIFILLLALSHYILKCNTLHEKKVFNVIHELLLIDL